MCAVDDYPCVLSTTQSTHVCCGLLRVPMCAEEYSEYPQAVLLEDTRACRVLRVSIGAVENTKYRRGLPAVLRALPRAAARAAGLPGPTHPTPRGLLSAGNGARELARTVLQRSAAQLARSARLFSLARSVPAWRVRALVSVCESDVRVSLCARRDCAAAGLTRACVPGPSRRHESSSSVHEAADADAPARYLGMHGVHKPHSRGAQGVLTG